LQGSSGILSRLVKAFMALIVASGLGHFATAIGRRALYCVAWKYVRFLQVVLGWWTDDLVDMYRVHETVHGTSAVWDDPFVKLEALEEEDERQTHCIALPEHDDEEDRYALFRVRKAQLKELENKKQLKMDYKLALYSIIATRATILQMIPYVSVLSIFASFTSGAPIFVQSKFLEENLQDGMITSPYKVELKFWTDHYDRLWAIKQAESTEESYTIPVPADIVLQEQEQEQEQAIITADGGDVILSAVSSDSGQHTDDKHAKKEIEEKNTLSRARQVHVMKEGKFVVRKWECALSAPGLLLNGSRYISFGKGLFKSIIAILLLYLKTSDDEKEDWSKTLSLVTMVVLAPFSIAQGMGVCVQIGRMMWISDEELYRELGWLFRLLCWIYSRCCCCFSRKAAAGTGTSTSTTLPSASGSSVELTSNPLQAAAAVAAAVEEGEGGGNGNNGADAGAKVGNDVHSSL
jgi:hypothetical protein